MVTPEWQSVVNYVFGAGLVAGFGGMIRWGIRVDRGLANTVKSTELLAEKLNGHEKIGNERHEALRESIDRVERLALASRDGA